MEFNISNELTDQFTDQFEDQLDQSFEPTPRRDLHEAPRLERSITIRKSIEELYQFWRNFENLPRFMSHVKAVRQITPERSVWTIRTLAGRELTWEAEIIEDHPNQMMSWQTVGNADVPQAGSVWFKKAPRDQGTEVRVLIQYDPPGGRLGEWLATLFGEDAPTAVLEDLHRLKAFMEVGEIPTIEGQPSGRDPKEEINKSHFRRTWSQADDSTMTHH